MIKNHSDDPDVQEAASEALKVIDDVLANLPKAASFDYGGHTLNIGEYDVCVACTTPIAEAQAVVQALHERSETVEDDTVKEHLELAAKLFQLEAETATIRAELHNGFGTEQILNRLLGFEYERHIGDDYHHSHHGGTA